MNGITFIKSKKVFNSTNAFICYISPGIKMKDELFKEFKHNLLLPDYFGNNWDALEECLQDLFWIKEERVLIIHADVPLINKQETKTYLQILLDVIHDRQKIHQRLEVIFPEEDKEILEELLEINQK